MLCCFRGSPSHRDNHVSQSPHWTPGGVGVSTINITGTSTLDPDFHALVGMPSPCWDCSLHLPDVSAVISGDMRRWGDEVEHVPQLWRSRRTFRDRPTKQTEDRGLSGAEVESGRPPALRQVGLLVGRVGSRKAGFGADNPGI